MNAVEKRLRRRANVRVVLRAAHAKEAKAGAFVQEGSARVHALNGLNAARAAAAQNASVRDAALPTPPHAISAAPH